MEHNGMSTLTDVNVLNTSFGILVQGDVEISQSVLVAKSLMQHTDVFAPQIITGLARDVSIHHVLEDKCLMQEENVHVLLEDTGIKQYV